ncbi:methylmalonyl-CoA epimerase, mitochondrial isoform X4 [Xenopus tropicalis]|uniref:Methylmalonyl-CoA epimerase, mitochondrial isoform X4 n=1 Tax=Xenopus tropicalis TaxID=8364 RepID=A0A8J1JAJ7_XENTR|nr:methylmalonyl-CoA epimerase, mitochondrial isoform X4 [Xenopus tropicalis]
MKRTCDGDKEEGVLTHSTVMTGLPGYSRISCEEERRRGRARLFRRVCATAQARRNIAISPCLVQKVPSSVWNLGRLNHVAIAVPDLEKACFLYEKVLGAQVDDIKAAMTSLKEKKIKILSEEPRIGAHGKPVVFLHPKDCDGVLVELEEA